MAFDTMVLISLGLITFFAFWNGFTDAANGTIVGANGAVLHTSNAGANWIPQTSVTNNRLRAVRFTDANTGTAVGDVGAALHEHRKRRLKKMARGV